MESQTEQYHAQIRLLFTFRAHSSRKHTMPRSSHDAPASAGAAKPRKPKAKPAPVAAAAPAPAPVAIVAAPPAAATPTLAGGASSRGKGRGKGVLPELKRRGKVETARAQRLRVHPISGISDGRLKVLACQMGLTSLRSEAKRAILAVVSANIEHMLHQAIVMAACSRRRTLRASHITEAYERENTSTQRLYLATADGAEETGERVRRMALKAVRAGAAAKKRARAVAAATEDDAIMH